MLCGVLVFTQLGTMQAFARPDWPSDTGIEAEAGAVMDVDTGTMLFGQNSHVEYYPASITKILPQPSWSWNMRTSLARSLTPDKAMNSVEVDSGNKLSLVAGDTMTVEGLPSTRCFLHPSTRRQTPWREHVAGSIPDFC